MPHSKRVLILILACALPGAAGALGLGEIRVQSALNEPLAAEVNLLGATAEDLAGISASVANSQTFLRLGLERPAFLSSTSFKIARDRQGQPVLAIRSTEAFTEPLIDVLIDLRWGSGELIRQYTLLLDPPRLPSDARVADAVPSGSEGRTAPAAPPAVRAPLPAPSPATSGPQAPAPVVGEALLPQSIPVGAGATLRGIAARIGSRGDPGLERTMMAIFRANPQAFEGNINRLRRGAVLMVPSFAEVSKIPFAEADRAIRLQMAAWHASGPIADAAQSGAMRATAPPASPDPSAAPARAAVPAAPPAAPEGGRASASTATASEAATLDGRVRRVETDLHALQGALRREQGTLAQIQARVALAERAPALTAVPPPTRPGQPTGALIAVVLVLAGAAVAIRYRGRAHRRAHPRVSGAEAQCHPSTAASVAAPAASRTLTPAAPARAEHIVDEPLQARATSAAASVADTAAKPRTSSAAMHLERIDDLGSDGADVLEPRGAERADLLEVDTAKAARLASAAGDTRTSDANADTTPLRAVRALDLAEVWAPGESAPEQVTATPDADTAKIQYQRFDLDGTVHHVPMPSLLHQTGEFKERRTSLVDVLKVAVKREPARRDLRMKLLETYYAAAATSRQGFLEIAQSLARERAAMADGEWGKITGMGRLIAADHDLFTPRGGPADKDLATCA